MNNRRSDKCYPITEDQTLIPPTHEFIRIQCTKLEDKEIDYKDHFGFVHLKPEVEARATTFEEDYAEEDQLSIIMLGLDSVSQMNFQRFMPKTRNFLLEDLSAVEFYGRNKVLLRRSLITYKH